MLLALVATVPYAQAGDDPNDCDAPGDYPDVIVGNLHQTDRYGPVGDITAFSLGTVSCNIGTCWLDWFGSPSNMHPVIGQNMFRLKDGRFEQLGQSWLKHGFTALDQNFCSNDCIDTTGEPPRSAVLRPVFAQFLNGQQSNLGPKFEVDAATGFHPHPVTDIGNTGNAIFKRLQVHNDDLDPDLNESALYFVEGQYVTEDDAAAGQPEQQRLLPQGPRQRIERVLQHPVRRPDPAATPGHPGLVDPRHRRRRDRRADPRRRPVHPGLEGHRSG